MSQDARAWYREEAERWGLSTRLRIDSLAESEINIVWSARIAGHFGRLALEQTIPLDQDGWTPTRWRLKWERR